MGKKRYHPPEEWVNFGTTPVPFLGHPPLKPVPFLVQEEEYKENKRRLRHLYKLKRLESF
jgi:hypothetical protein